ncbi:MAG: hypothetical protein L0229_30290, partial [Blastocatellia bacterium]|nr:hypothetical protein [Blastocatellia bacterium]
MTNSPFERNGSLSILKKRGRNRARSRLSKSTARQGDHSLDLFRAEPGVATSHIGSQGDISQNGSGLSSAFSENPFAHTTPSLALQYIVKRDAKNYISPRSLDIIGYKVLVNLSIISNSGSVEFSASLWSGRGGDSRLR